VYFAAPRGDSLAVGRIGYARSRPIFLRQVTVASMKQGLQLRTSQHLSLTPQLQQAIKLLQLSTIELSQEIEQMLQDNPFLEQESTEQSYEEALQTERAQQEATSAQSDHAADFEWDGAGSAAEAIASTGDTFNTSVDSNPKESNEATDTASETQITDDWEGEGSHEVAADDAEWGNDAPAKTSNAEGGGDADASAQSAEHVSLQDYLHRQTIGLRLSEEDRAALMLLIESLNEDGYLEDSFESLAESLGANTLEEMEELVQRFGLALRLLHQMEPPGVGARHLSECLKLQLLALPALTPARAVALAICAQPLDLLAKRDTKRLASTCQCSIEEVKEAIALISRLDPKPGRQFADLERNIVVPDVIVTAQGRGTQQKFKVQLNTNVMPRLRVHDMYAQALKGGKSEGHIALQGRLQEARWFIKNIQQRFDTILRVSNAIVERQRSFFAHGALAMRPLVLREIADELGLHESTISRVTTAKYMSTPHGTFELKYFFGSGLQTETGGNASSTAVRALIEQFIGAENRNKPLSDNALADMLKEQGIECARRTVAKYREALRIAPTHLRKTL
jgi:RNA polymerase sigma-54 factor